MTLLRLVRREFFAQVRSVKFAALSGTAVLLACLAINLGGRDLHLSEQRYQLLLVQRAADRAAEERLTGRDVEPGLRAVRAPAPLGAFVRGIDQLLPRYWDFSPAGVREGPSGTSPATDAGSPFDVEFVVRIVLGLLAITIGLEAISGDRDSGTLHAVLSQPVSSWLVLTSKVVGAMSSLALSVGLLLAGMMAATVAWVPEVSGDQLIGFLGIFAAVTFLYLLALVSCGLLVSALVRSSRTAQIIGVLAWFFAALVAPQFVVFTASALAGPPRAAVEAQQQSIYDTQFRRTQESLGDMLGRSVSGGNANNVASIDTATLARLDDLWRTRISALQATIDGVEAKATAAADRQRRAVRLMLLMSPSTQFSEGVTLAAGTGWTLRTRWHSAVDRYQSLLAAQLFDDRPKIAVLVPNGDYRALKSLSRREAQAASSLPDFAAPTESLRERLRDTLPDLVVLGAYSTVFLVGAFIAFARTDL